MIQIEWDRHNLGWAAFRGPKEDGRKLCDMMTRHDKGLRREGMVIHEVMPPSSWLIHFTSPQMHIDLLRAVMESLPTDP